MRAPLTAMLLGLAALCGAASAQTVYKCVSDGKTSYGTTPCPSGRGVALDVPPPPAPAPDAAAALARDEKTATRLRAERLRREAREDSAQARAGKAAAARRKKCAALALRQKWAAEDARGAGEKTATKARVKARRAAEKLALECPA
ncbi:DUF4124 domain-containing protein [Janthinobacterium sp.]|uniref:DUF4124 domain-containing protein n=1 Tax=Janthinobacterium sp. TaxID=1871054 RepID=UPI00293D80EE|nr:DUF4124 domain-containing protein [Janthinobacterium sp.]